MFIGRLIKRRLLAVLDHDGVPKRRRAAFLAKAGKISRSAAYRLLDSEDSRAPRRISFYANISRETDISLDWLLCGELRTANMRTLRIYIQNFLGYPKQDTDRIMRMFVAYMADHKKATNLLGLAISGAMSLASAARLFQPHVPPLLHEPAHSACTVIRLTQPKEIQ